MNNELTNTLRRADLGSLVEMLRKQADVRWDAVVPAERLRYQEGLLAVAGGAVEFSEASDGTLEANEVTAYLQPTDVFEDCAAQRLDVPRAYLRRLRDERIRIPHDHGACTADCEVAHRDLLDATVNSMFARMGSHRFLVRGFRTDDADEVGIARALLSDRYAPLDNYDVLLAALSGVREAGVDASSLAVEADMSERNMRVRIVAPEISALAPTLLANYRSPFTPGSDMGNGTVQDAGGKDLPVVFAGFVVGNSETGGGAFTITPRLVVQVCNNGMTRKADQLRAVHLGAKLEEGVVRWSEQTKRASLDLIVARTRDAVRTYLDADYVATVVRDIEERSGAPVNDVVATIERVAKQHAFTAEEQAGILDCFIRSGDTTAGGVMQAVTATAQMVDDPERAAYLEDSALEVLATAAG